MEGERLCLTGLPITAKRAGVGEEGMDVGLTLRVMVVVSLERR